MRRLLIVLLLRPRLARQPPRRATARAAPRAWSFPRDHGRHDGFKIEWWYFTGNCRDAAGHRFGYELTFFRSALDPRQPDRASPWATSDVYFAHAAVTDVAGGHFAAKDRIERGRPGLAWASDRGLDVLAAWTGRSSRPTTARSASRRPTRRSAST